MGCSQSKHAMGDATPSRKPQSSAKKSARASSAPITRDRIDSWAISNSHPDPTATLNNSATTGSPVHLALAQASPSSQSKRSSPSQAIRQRPSVESQWKFLWETHSSLLLDPADVHSVLDSLLCRTVNLLSPVELTLIQRRVRSTVRALAASSKPRAVFNTKTETEAQTIVERHHLLHESLISKILPHSLLQRNAYLLMLHLSETLWDRVADVAALTAVKAHLEMDVNKQSQRTARRMPKPSIVPDVSPAELPLGVSLQSLSFIIAMARYGSRKQQLLLLFYLLVEQLGDFLANHPAGGVPTWLLEVEQGTVISLASLIHYHYFGHGGILPLSDVVNIPAFCSSSSRQPLTIPVNRLRQVLQSAFMPPQSVNMQAPNAASGTESEGTGNATPSRRNSKPQIRVLAQRRSSESNNGDSRHGEMMESSSVDRTTCYSKTLLMQRLAAVRDNPYASIGEQPHDITFALLLLEQLERQQTLTATELENSPSRKKKIETGMTLQIFVDWANEALDDAKLAALMDRLFTCGILPAAAFERELVQEKWQEWQSLFNRISGTDCASQDALTRNIELFLNRDGGSEMSDETKCAGQSNAPWGGIGGIDGGGAMGYGVLYCLDKLWWDQWTSFVGWTVVGERPTEPSGMKRPGALSTERLLERHQEEEILKGTLGSYENMKHGLHLNIDYVLVPSGVWDILYELYGGGPPLPRIVKPPVRKVSEYNRANTDIEDSNRVDLHSTDDLDHLVNGLDTSVQNRVQRIPENVCVAIHPWIIQVHLCDPSQPYRRGEAGIQTIHIMTMPDAPLWRLLSEIVMRFPLHAYKAFDQENRGKARLWKKCEQRDVALSRYGPWTLLLKTRHAIVPFLADANELIAQLPELIENWKTYSDNSTVEGIGLNDQDLIMFEFQVLNKSSELAWPREAAAKAGKVRRLAEEDAKFRAMLLGVDDAGALLLKPAILRGMEVDAMDATGRWYPVTILESDIIDEEIEEGLQNGNSSSPGRPRTQKVSKKKVRVDFTEHGGHQEWIDVNSDRLAAHGRFTGEADNQASPIGSRMNGGSTSSQTDGRAKSGGASKKALSSDGAPESGKICLWPGFGACGLTNLGNTCYSNSAIQCMSYLPVLRSYLLSAQFKSTGDLNKDNPLGSGGKLLEEFADLLRAMWSAKVGEKSPSRFRAHLGKINIQFAGADQQDAQEFLNYIMDMLHEDSNRVRKKPYVEAVDDDWVEKTDLSRVGDEAWRRFLRRNRSIMTDVAMGQVLNTVTCPACKFTSKNFDPFNLLSIPIPSVADVFFRCTLYRRATGFNCPWVLNRPRKNEKKSGRYSKFMNSIASSSSPGTYHSEEYILAMSRLADLDDIRLKLQHMCGIPAHQLKLCRLDIKERDRGDNSVLDRQFKVTQLSEKEGPCSQLARRTLPGEKGHNSPTQIIAYESTLRFRPLTPTDPNDEALDETADEDEDLESEDLEQFLPTAKEQAEIEKYLEFYGDDKECRIYDTNPHLIAKAVSRSLWPREEHELKLGLRVDAKDQRGNWFPGNVVELVNGTNGSPSGGGSTQTRKVRVHFDNFSSKWDELYGIEDFKESRVRPLYAHSAPRRKPTEFMVHHRCVDRATGKNLMFGQSFYLQCQNDWSNARAGAHILAQASRFVNYETIATVSSETDDNSSSSHEATIRRLFEKAQLAISNLIDLLIDCDREYVRIALGLSEHNTDLERQSPFRNPSFDPTTLSNTLVKKVTEIIHKLPFEIRVSTMDGFDIERNSSAVDETTFHFSLIRTIGNYMNARHQVILHWREPLMDKKTRPLNNLESHVLYTVPAIVKDEAGARELELKLKTNEENGNLGRPGHAGIDLGVCLTEFCKTQKLTMADCWRCPRCKDFREGQQRMNLWRLPDLLTFHIKRFNMSARWKEKITTKVNFPLTGLDMSDWIHKESPLIHSEATDSYVYDLIGVVNHYGSMTGGHYVATCKASACGREGQEEVAYSFNGTGTAFFQDEDTDTPSGWRLGRNKAEVNQNKVAAAMASQIALESAEPLWLQFDDEVVEAVSPEHVVSELAYVLFYKKRQMTPSNVAKYSSLE